MARPKAVKSAAALEAEAAKLMEQAKQLRKAQIIEAGELVKQCQDKQFTGFDLEKFKAQIAKIFEG